MKKLLFVLSLVMVFLVAAPMAMALKITTVGGYGPYQTGSGGEFTLKPTDGLEWVLNAGYVDKVTKNVLGLTDTFQSFCVENVEYVYANTKFDVALSQASVYTGKPLTLGAAWLYHQFQINQLQGYDYNRVRVGGILPITQQLQDAIWYFMGVAGNPNNQFSVAGLANGGFGLNNGQIPVAVINMWALGHLNDPAYARQDMLVCVPEPATMFFMGAGLLGMAGFLRRKFKK